MLYCNRYAFARSPAFPIFAISDSSWYTDSNVFLRVEGECMDFFEAVRRRYSHKEAFAPDAVPIEVLEQIAEAGLAAATGMNSQCVRLVILPDRESVASLSDIAKNANFATAPAAIAVLTDSSAQGSKVNFEVEDYSAATQSMLLAATALGYSALWLDSPFFHGKVHAEALKALEVPPGYQLKVVIPIGKPAGETARRPKKAFAERVSYKVFGGTK